MTSPDTNTLVGLSDADIMRMGVAALLRIAAALEAQREPEPETLEYPLSQLKGFDWASIGATIVARDEDGTSVIRTAEGKFAKRRSNDKFGVEVWFSYATGKKPDGTNLYRKVVEFKDSKPAEPLGRKTAQALSQATPTTNGTPPPAESPLMAPIRKRWAELAIDHNLLSPGTRIPERFALSPKFAVPENQHRTDEFEQYVTGLRMAKADHAPARAAVARTEAAPPKPLTWAVRVYATQPGPTTGAALKAMYAEMTAELFKRTGIAPYADGPAGQIEAHARCRDMAAELDKQEAERSQEVQS